MYSLKRYWALVCVFNFHYLISQIEIVKPGNNKVYRVYTSIADAQKANIDSVFGLKLMSNGFEKFPMEILKFKKLKYLEIGSYLWQDVIDSLTIAEKKELEERQKNMPYGATIYKYYKISKISNIPPDINLLTDLEILDFTSVKLNYKKFRKIYKYLPNTLVLPDKKTIQDYFILK